MSDAVTANIHSNYIPGSVTKYRCTHTSWTKYCEGSNADGVHAQMFMECTLKC